MIHHIIRSLSPTPIPFMELGTVPRFHSPTSASIKTRRDDVASAVESCRVQPWRANQCCCHSSSYFSKPSTVSMCCLQGKQCNMGTNSLLFYCRCTDLRICRPNFKAIMRLFHLRHANTLYGIRSPIAHAQIMTLNNIKREVRLIVSHPKYYLRI